MSFPINKTIIYMPIFNRKKIALESILNLKSIKGEAHLALLDDASTEFSAEEIITLGDSGTCNQQNLGIDKNRIIQLVHFLNSNFEYCYFTDSDTIHDPHFLERLFHIHQTTKTLSCLYNSNGIMHKDGFNIFLENDIIIRKTIPGISMFFDREQALRIYQYYDEATRYFHQIVEYYGWDWFFCQVFPFCALSQMSYVEHLCYGGIHATGPDHAKNLTPWLKNERIAIFQRLGLDETFTKK
jgi:hypothetical protein